jgi:hypothetical protein
MVDDFLKNENLVLRDSLLPLPIPPVQPPADLSNSGREEFPMYLQGAPHKALAVSTGGHFGMIFGQRSAPEAEKHALENCKRHASKDDPCTIVMIDDEKTQN